MKMMTREGMVSMGFNSITTSGFLAAFALALGANNLQIGVLAAIPFIMQPLQIPTILLVEKLRKRKIMAVSTWVLAQSLWIPMALIPFLIKTPSAGAISMLLGLMAIRSLLSAITNCNWNSWIRDLIPQNILGRFYSRRLALSTIVAIIFGLSAAFFVDYWKGQVPSDSAILGYTYVFLFGAIFLGLMSPLFMSLMPEPLMQTVPGAKPSLKQTLILPFRDKNFRKLMRFLLFWGFASNLATPFFAVYMLQRLGLPLSLVIGLSILSQLFNILFLRVWGPLVDRFGTKVILSLCSSLYLLVILGWTFTTMPEKYVLTIPLLAILHIFAGIAIAGVSLTIGTIGLKLAPKEQATTYLTGASLSNNIGAGIGPLVGGLFADFFNSRVLALDFTLTDPTNTFNLGLINLTGYDFLFVIAFFIGIITISTLTGIHEDGEVSREVVLDELMAQSRSMTRPVSSVPGLSIIGRFPYNYLRRVPGMDVAVGVTSYQMADMTRVATLSAIRGQRATTKITKALESSLAKVLKKGGALQANSKEITRQSIRGVIHALSEIPKRRNEGSLVRSSVLSIIQTLQQAKADPKDILPGIGYGLIQGANEAGKSLTDATNEAIINAREIAKTMGLDEKVTLVQVASGLMEAAEAIGPEALAQVRNSLPSNLNL
ncbi:MFS transporter [Chloroflexota bacterium]